MRVRLLILLVFCSAIILPCCAGKNKDNANLNFAANRRVTISLGGELNNNQDPESNGLSSLISDYLYQQYYLSLRQAKKSANSEKEAEFNAALQLSDDYFWLRKAGEDYRLIAGNVPGQRKFLDIIIKRGTNKTQLFSQLKLALDKNYKNPNDLPSFNILAMADKYYQQKDCFKAKPLYEKFLAGKTVSYLQEIEERGKIEQNLEKCTKIVSLKEKISSDKGKRFSFSFKHSGLAPKYVKYIEQGLNKVRLEKLLRKYTYKPVSLEVRYNSENRYGTVLLKLRFHQHAYKKWTSRKVKTANGLRILHLSPYNALIKRILKVESYLYSKVPENERGSLNFATILHLEKLNGDWVELPIERGTSQAFKNPSQLRVKVGGYDPSEVKTADINLSRQTGLFYLGQAELISGQKTEYGILYSFFGLK